MSRAICRKKKKSHGEESMIFIVLVTTEGNKNKKAAYNFLNIANLCTRRFLPNRKLGINYHVPPRRTTTTV